MPRVPCRAEARPLQRLARGSVGLWGGLLGLVAVWGWEIPIPLYGLSGDLALDGYERVEELVGDVGEDGGTARGDAVLHDED